MEFQEYSTADVIKKRTMLMEEIEEKGQWLASYCENFALITPFALVPCPSLYLSSETIQMALNTEYTEYWAHKIYVVLQRPKDIAKFRFLFIQPNEWDVLFWG